MTTKNTVSPINSEIIKEVITSMANSFALKERESAAKVFSQEELNTASELIKTGNWRDFHHKFNRPLEKASSGILNTVLKPEDYQLRYIFENCSYIQRQIASLIIPLEGMGCSSDKARAVIDKMVDFYLNGNEIYWNREAEYTYHMPIEVFCTQESILSFLNALLYLNSGQPALYLQYMMEWNDRLNFLNKEDLNRLANAASSKAPYQVGD